MEDDMKTEGEDDQLQAKERGQEPSLTVFRRNQV